VARAIVNRQAALTSLRDELDQLAASPPCATQSTDATLRAARRLNRATGVLATSVLLDSAVEHYRGSFRNPRWWCLCSSPP
jgi:hypothetical protein